jgi:cobalt-zinc-cadmium efflux system protein
MGILKEDLENKKQQWIGIVLNLLCALTEVIAGLHYNSGALLTDAGHNFSDAVSLGISFWIEKKQPRLAAFINAAVLLTSAGFLGYGAFVRLFNPEVVSSGNIVWVAALGIIINGVSAFLFFPQRHEPIQKLVTCIF